jgi:glycosyltransferase involved in cell wall biosynthesis
VNPFFSIIIPTYNSAGKLPCAIESVLEQSYSDFEIIISDGRSFDNTLSVASGYNDDRIKIFSEKDAGVYDAMNKGIRHASGEWLLFLGSDDTLSGNGVLGEVHSYLSKSSADFFYGNVKVVGEVNWSNGASEYDGPFTIKKLLSKNICQQAIFYRRSLVRSHNIWFDLRYPVCSDWDFNLKCWSVSEFAYIPTVVSDFFAGGLSSNKAVVDPFYSEVVKKYVQYFNIRSYLKLRKVVPLERSSQMGDIEEFKTVFRTEKFIRFVLNVPRVLIKRLFAF